MATHAVKRPGSKVKKKTITTKTKPVTVLVGSGGIINNISKWDAGKKIEVIEHGVSKKQFEDVKKQTELDYDTLASVLSVTKATLHNKKGDAKFSAAVSERILLLADIYTYGYDVFGDKEKFNHWMFRKNMNMGGKMPIEMLQTLYGIQEVKDALGRIEYGVYI